MPETERPRKTAGLAWQAQLLLLLWSGVSIGFATRLYGQERLITELREKNDLLREVADVRARNTVLTEENCSSTHAIEGMCSATLTELTTRLGLKDQLEPLLRSATWRRLKAKAPSRAEAKRLVGGIGGGDP